MDDTRNHPAAVQLRGPWARLCAAWGWCTEQQQELIARIANELAAKNVPREEVGGD